VCFITTAGLLDNVLSDYLWAKAVLLTTTTVATAGLTIQVPLAAIVDSLSGNKPSFTDYIGAAAVMVGFAGINIPSEMFCKSKETAIELEPGTSFTDPPPIVPDSIRVDSSLTVV
jgi:solute carrier family 35 protein F5